MSRIWAGLESHLHLAPGPGHAPQVGPATQAAGTGALAGKITLAVVLVSAAGVGLHRLHLQDRPAGMDAKPIAVVVPSPLAEPVAGVAALERAAARAAPTMKASRPRGEMALRSKPGVNPPTQAAPAPATIEVERSPRTEAEGKPLASSWGPPARAASPPEEPLLLVNELLEESRQLGRARAALRAHDPDHALKLLESYAFRNTALAQEREALTIEALAAKPTLRAQATVRARAFMKTYPQSPYRARIRAIALEGE